MTTSSKGKPFIIRFIRKAFIVIFTFLTSIWLIQVVNDFRLTDMDSNIEITNLITHNFTDPNTIEMISLFNSEAGHVFNDSSNLETSMKHYFDAPNNNNESVPFYSPFDGKIVVFKSSGSGGSGGNDIWIQNDTYPNIYIRFFHIEVSEKVQEHFGSETGDSSLFTLVKSILGFPSKSEPLSVSGGEFLGTGAGDVSLEILDYAENLVFFCSEPFPKKLPILWFSPQCSREVRLGSVFNAMNDAVLNEWKEWGITLENIIVTPKERENFSTFRAASSTNSTFIPRDFETQKKHLYSLNLDVITGESEKVEINFPVGSILLILSEERIQGELSSGKNIKGFDGHGRGGYIDPYYPKPEEGDLSDSFKFYLKSSGEWYAVIVPPESSITLVRPFATYLKKDGEYVSRSSGG